MASGFKSKGDWRAFEKMLNSRAFSKRLEKEIGKATKQNGLLVQKTIRQNLRNAGSKYLKNAMLTIGIKRSTKPLSDHGDLFGAITIQQQDSRTVFVGVLQQAKVYNIAVAIHDGRTIEITPAMRKLFYVLWRASVGSIDPSTLTGRARELWDRKPGHWEQFRDDTMAIRIPPRPFMKDAFEDSEVRAKVFANWEAAVKRALSRSGAAE